MFRSRVGVAWRTERRHASLERNESSPHLRSSVPGNRVLRGVAGAVPGAGAPDDCCRGELEFCVERDCRRVCASPRVACGIGLRRFWNADAADTRRGAIRAVPGGRRGVPESIDRGGTDAGRRRCVCGRPAGAVCAERLAPYSR